MPAKRPRPRPTPELRDQDGVLIDAADPYLRDQTGARHLAAHGPLDGAGRSRRFRRADDPAVLLAELLEIDHLAAGDDDGAAYLAYAEGFTRRNKAAGGDHPDVALGRELRPGFVAFLMRRLRQNDEELAGHVVQALLGELRAMGAREQRWATALALRLCWGLSHGEIARDMGLERSTVTKYLQEARLWLIDAISRQAWMTAYLRDEALPRYHIDADLIGTLGDEQRGEAS